MSEKKNFVLDTNILLLDPRSIFKFEDNNVIIPMVVLEELDNKKSVQGSVGYNAREVSRILDKLSNPDKGRGKLSQGAKLNDGGTLLVYECENAEFHEKNDNKIIAHAQYLHDVENDNMTVLVSNDCNVRLKARSMDILAEGYEPSDIKIEDKNFKGFKNLTSEDCQEGLPNLYENEYVNIDDKLGRFTNGHINGLKYPKDLPVKALNTEQHYVLDALTDPKIKLVTITGKAGTGKTLLASGAGITQVLNENFRKLVIARPIMPMGNDIGYLPGSKEEKLGPWMQPIFDNIEFLTENRTNDKGVYSIEDMMEEGILELEALTYIRGRTFHNQFLIIDEAQNLSALEIKTIITRAGENTKIVLTGDVEQIDSPHLDSHNNGLSLVIDRFKTSAIAAHIHLEACERSELAEFAAENL